MGQPQLIIPVHSLDPIPHCQTARVENIIAQFRAICTGNFDFLSLQDKCGQSARRLASRCWALEFLRHSIYYRCALLPFLKIPLFKRSIYVLSKSNEYIGKYCLLSFINKAVIIMNV
jgi:hypothetical protein